MVHHTALPADHHIDAIPVLDMDHFHIQDTNHFKNTFPHIDFLQDQEPLDFLDPDLILKQKKQITFKQRIQIHLSTLNTICTIPLRWPTL